MNLLWSRIYDLVIKSILSGEHAIVNSIRKNNLHRNNCFELFGYDILLDSDLKPWLVEINLSPSLAVDSPLDFQIKSNLIADTFNLIGVKKFDRRKESLNKMKNRMMYRGKSYNPRYSSSFNQMKGNSNTIFTVTNGNNASNDFYMQTPNPRLQNEVNKYLELNNASDMEKQSMLKIVQIKHKDILLETMSEYNRRGNFVRVYPAKNSDIYDQFFQGNRYLNKLIYKALFTSELIPTLQLQDTKLNYVVNFEMPSYDNIKKKIIITEETKTLEEQEQPIMQEIVAPIRVQSAQIQSKEVEQIIENKKIEEPKPQKLLNQTEKNLQQSERNFTEKILITGDDVLIEYVERLITKLKGIQESDLSKEQIDNIDSFVDHRVWHSSRRTEGKYWLRLEQRLQEMKERRKRLVKSIYKREGKLNEFEKKFQIESKQKSNIIKKIDAIQLEDMLRTSTKNVAQEVVSSLIRQTGGILTELTKKDFVKKNECSESAETDDDSNKRPEEESEVFFQKVEKTSQRPATSSVYTRKIQSRPKSKIMYRMDNSYEKRNGLTGGRRVSYNKMISRHDGLIIQGGTLSKEISQRMQSAKIKNFTRV